MGAPPPRHPGQGCVKSHSRGFTLIELVAAIVILGAIVAVALPVFRDLRYDARRASVESVGAMLRANFNAARTAYLAQGLGAGSTVRVNGKSIEVFGEGVVDHWGAQVPPGAPTAAGMFVMLDCGAVAPAQSTDVPCASLSGYTAWAQDSWLLLHLSQGNSNCSAGYYSPYGYDPGYPGEGTWGDAWSRWGMGTEILWYPASLGYTGGC